MPRLRAGKTSTQDFFDFIGNDRTGFFVDHRQSRALSSMSPNRGVRCYASCWCKRRSSPCAAIAPFLPPSLVHLSSLLHLPPFVSIPLFHAGKAMRPILGVPAGEAPLVAGLRPGRVGIFKRHPAPISVAQFRIATMQFEIVFSDIQTQF